MDWDLFLAIGFLALTLTGLVLAGLALYYYLRFESSADIPRVPVAMTVFVAHYGLVLVLGLAVSHRYSLLPTILMLLTTIALITVMRLGWQAHTKAGNRIALAGLLVSCAYLCYLVHDYRLFGDLY